MGLCMYAGMLDATTIEATISVRARLHPILRNGIRTYIKLSLASPVPHFDLTLLPH